MSFDGERVTGGLKASTDIPAATYILTACGSMSSDVVDSGGLSVIESKPEQLGPEGLRVILGPFRFVNHDCKPNCQVSSQSPGLERSLTILKDTCDP